MPTVASLQPCLALLRGRTVHRPAPRHAVHPSTASWQPGSTYTTFLPSVRASAGPGCIGPLGTSADRLTTLPRRHPCRARRWARTSASSGDGCSASARIGHGRDSGSVDEGRPRPDRHRTTSQLPTRLSRGRCPIQGRAADRRRLPLSSVG